MTGVVGQLTLGYKPARRWRRRLGLAAAAVLVAGGLLLPVGGSAVAQPDGSPTSPIGARAPSPQDTPLKNTPPKDTPPKDTTSASQVATLFKQERTKAGCASMQFGSTLQNPDEQRSRDQAARDRSGGD